MKKKTDLRCLASGPISAELKARILEVAELEANDDIYPLSSEVFVEKLKSCSAAICVFGEKIDAEVMKACPDLRIIANVAVGFDNIDVEEATRRGIIVTNTPGVLDNATADLAFTLLLSLSRRIVEADSYVREKKWERTEDCLLAGRELSGKTLGILGMGRIGEAMARRGRGFGMKIVYTRRGDEEKDKFLQKELGATRLSLGELLKHSDFVSIHCPLNRSTRHLIGRAELAQMKSTAMLINTARGAIINEVELVKALQEGKIAGAGLDVFEFEPTVTEELLTLKNVVLTPHIGSSTTETRNAMKALAVENLVSTLSGILPKNAVNREVWPNFIARMDKVIVLDEDEDTADNQHQLSMPWS
ncbi:MAG TPA: D-glycerate dehydrogenase [Oculatellaceae cyanobacterium]